MATGLIGVMVGGSLSLVPTPTAVAAAGINKMINFQGKVVNTNGTNVADGSYTFVFKLYSVSSGGSAIWTESKTLTTTDGIFQTNLGSVTSLPGSVDFNTDSIYLGINYNSDGEMSPRIQFTAAAYAFNSDALQGLHAADFAQINPATAQSGSLNVTGSVQAATSLLTPNLDTATGVPLVIGGTTATAVTVGKVTTAFTLQGNSSSVITAKSGSNTTTVGFTAPSGANTINFPDAGGTICTTVATTCSGTYSAAGSFVNLQATTPGTAQTGHLNLTGTGILGTSLQTPLLDTPSGTTTLNIGTTNATSGIALNQSVTVLGGKSLSLASGTGTFSQIYVNTSGTAHTVAATDSAASGATTLSAEAINLTGTDNASGSNALTGLNFGNVTAHTNNSYYGLNFGTGLTDILRYNNTTQLISGTGILQNAAIGSGVNYSNLTQVGTLTSGALGTGFTTVAPAQGGTGQTTYTDGQLLIGNSTGNTLTKATLTGTANRLSVTNGSGSITLNVDTTQFPSSAGANTVLVSSGANAASWVANTAANVCSDCIVKVPAVGQNVIAPTAASVVGLTVKGTTNGTTGNVLEIFNANASPTRQDFFDAAGSLNVAQVVQPTTNNAVDLGVSGTAFRTGYFGTSVLAPTFDTPSGTTTLNVGTTNATAGINLNQSTTVAANKNLTLAGGAGTFSQAYTSASVSSAQVVSITNTNTGAGVAIQGVDLTPNNTATATSGSNVVNVVNFNGSGALGGTDITNGINFASATGYTNYLKTPTAVLTSGGAFTGLTGVTLASGNITTPGNISTSSSGTITSASTVTVGSFAAATSNVVCSNAGTLSTCNANPSGVTLQQAYNAGNTILTGANDIAFTLAGSQNFTVATAAAATGSTTFSLTNGSNPTPPAQLVLITNNDTDQTLAAGLKVTSAAGTITTAIDVSGANFTNAIALGANKVLGGAASIAFTNFTVSGAGAVVGVGVNSGTGLLQGTGGLTVTGATNINATGTALTNLGNSTGVLTVASGGSSAWANTAGNLAISTVTSGNISVASVGTLALSGTNFTLSTAGAVTLLGGQTADITTLAGAAPTALVFQPGSNNTATSTGAAFTLQAGNDSGTTASTGGLLTLKGGNATGSAQVGGGVTIDSGSGTTGGAIAVGTANAASLALGRSGVTTTANGTLQVGASAGTGAFVNNGTTKNATLAIGDTASGPIGSAATTVDIYTSFTINQTTTVGATLTVPTPTAGAGPSTGRVIYVANIGTKGFTLLTGGATLSPSSSATLVFNGTAWTFAGADGSGILNQNTTDQTADFRISGTGRANTSFISPTFDAIAAGTLNFGNATATTIQVGTNGASNPIINLDSGTSNINIGTGGQARTIAIGTGASVVQTINIGGNGSNVIGLGNAQASGSVGIGTAMTTGSVTIGGGTSATTTLQAGSGNINLNAAAVATNQTTIALFNATATTVNAFGAATAITMGTTNAVVTYGGGAAATLRTSGGALTVTSAAAATWSTAAGALTISGAGGATVTSGNVSGAATNDVLLTSGNVTSGAFASGNAKVDVGTSTGTTGTVSIGATNASGVTIGRSTTTTTNVGNLTTGTAGSSVFTNNSATLNTALALGDLATGFMGASAAATVDVYTAFTIAPAASGRSYTIRSPTSTAAGRVIYVSNIHATSSFTLVANSSVLINPGVTATLVWNGAAWTFAGTDASSLQAAYNNSTDPEITLGPASTAGISIRDNATPISGNLLEVQNNGGTTSYLAVTAAAATLNNDLLFVKETNHKIQISDSTTAAAAGGNLTVQAAAGNTSGLGGNLVLNAGAGGNAAAGGQVQITAGAAGGGNNNGGQAYLQGGTATGSGTGGTASLLGGLANSTAGSLSVGGAVAITGQTGATGLNATSGAAGGAVTITSGSGGAGTVTNSSGGNAADVVITAGNGGAATGSGTNGNGGNVRITAGNAGGTANGTPGVVQIDTPVFTANTETFTQTSNNQAFNSGTDPALQTNIDSFSTIVMNVTGAFSGATITVPSPRNTLSGRVVYITVANGSVSFTMSATSMPNLNMLPNDIAMLVWNGTNWTASIAANSLQQVYNSTSTAPASIVTTSTTKTITVQAGAGFNAANLFVVANSNSSSVIAVDSTPINTIISNQSFEGPSVAGWTYSGTPGSVATNSTEHYIGASSMAVTTTNNTNQGAKYVTGNTSPTQLAVSTTYTLSWYAKSSNAFTDMMAAYARAGSAETQTCTPSDQVVSTSGWKRFTCSFTTDSTAPASTAFIVIRDTAASVRTFYVDGVQIEAAAVANPFHEAAVQLNGVVTSPVALQNASDSTTALLIQNSTASNTLLRVDTLNNVLVMGDSTNNVTIASTREPTLNGTARHAKSIRLNAEYAGAILDTGGSSSILGTMTAAIDTGQNPDLTYYKWTTSQATAQSYDVVVNVPVPDDWAAWTGSPTFKVYTSGGTGYSVVATITETNGTTNDPSYNTFTMLDGSHNNTTATWLTVSNPNGATYTNNTTAPALASGAAYAAGGIMTVRIHLVAAPPVSNVAQEVRIGDITFPYVSRW